MERIFKSSFRLNYLNKEIEKEYVLKKQEKMEKFGTIITLTVLVLCIISSTSVSLFYAYYERVSFKAIISTSYLTTFASLSLTVFHFIFRKNLIFQKVVQYCNYIFLVFVFDNIRYPLFHYVSIEDILVYLFLLVEMTIRLLWTLFSIFGFIENFSLNLASVVIIWVVYGPVSLKQNLTSNELIILAYTLTVLIIILFCYFLEKQRKTAFYFYQNSESRAKWLSNILDNINGGDLSIKSGSVKYMNRIFREIVDSELGLINSSNDEINSQININNILYFLINDLQTEHNRNVNFHFSQLKEEVKSEFEDDILNSADFMYNLLTKVLKSLNRVDGIADFTYIGEKVIAPPPLNSPRHMVQASSNNNKSEVHLEIFCRLTNFSLNEYELEFLFNDVTRSKIVEKQKAEFKYKSLFLSKVAHEFKNPLICIGELIHQINDEIVFNTENKSNYVNKTLKDYLKQIKAMSDFLLVLVKDLTYFSNQQISKSLTSNVEKKETNLGNLLDFCTEITNSLLLRYNKSKNINFRVEKSPNTPTWICTDEWRLKQILVNLLSNAIKFTLYGEIKIEIGVLEGISACTKFVEFVISDTGVGIKSEDKENLFKPFEKGTSNSGVNNELGTGLGLSIVRDLTREIGGEIRYTSGEGMTKFWFSIPIEGGWDEIHQKHVKHIKPCIEDSVVLTVKESESESESETQSVKTKIISYQPFKLNISGVNSEEIIKKEKDTPLDSLNKVIRIDDLINISSLDTIPYLRSNECLNILIVDDEKLSAQSSIRVVRQACKNLNKRLNIINLDDGIETIFMVYFLIKNGVKIDLIFSDETMNFMNGIRSSQIIKEWMGNKNLPLIPFYLITSYGNIGVLSVSDSNLAGIIAKPLILEDADIILKSLN